MRKKKHPVVNEFLPRKYFLLAYNFVIRTIWKESLVTECQSILITRYRKNAEPTSDYVWFKQQKSS